MNNLQRGLTEEALCTLKVLVYLIASYTGHTYIAGFFGFCAVVDFLMALWFFWKWNKKEL